MVFAACRLGGDPAGPDASRDGTTEGSDGSPSALGMFVTWRANPPLPGVVTNEITVSQAAFQLDHLQVVGDAGTDARTTHSKYLLTWALDTKPAQESFPLAPVGVYSKISLVMMTGNLSENAYEIHGTWTDGTLPPKQFEIRDRVPLAISIDCDETLPAAGMANLTIRVDLKDALNGIDFTQLEDEDGGLELKEGPQLVAFRARLKNAFKLDD